jgi:hypothetical protein
MGKGTSLIETFFIGIPETFDSTDMPGKVI